MKYKAIREHEFQAGHRVYNHDGNCKHLHGHSYVAKISCYSITDELDDLGMVMDFSVIKNVICTWIDEQFDHRFILWEHDPLGPQLQNLDNKVNLVPFNPTAENIAAYILQVSNEFLLPNCAKNVKVSNVEIQETGKCTAEVSNE